MLFLGIKTYFGGTIGVTILWALDAKNMISITNQNTKNVEKNENLDYQNLGLGDLGTTSSYETV